MNRREFALAGLAAALIAPPARADAPRLLVMKTATCGCCSAWIDHLADAGFEVTALDLDQEALWAEKARARIPEALSSCHTALVAGYVIEGHVPAGDIRRLLRDRPRALGLAVPGMPLGSPGMEVGGRTEPFETLLLRPDGTAESFARHG